MVSQKRENSSLQFYGLGSAVALSTLEKNKVSALPVSVSEICAAEHIKLISYRQGAKILRLLSLKEKCGSAGAFSLRYMDKKMILYNDRLPREIQRFYAARELGHFLLEQLVLSGGIHAPADGLSLEKQSNQFAADLLAPTCVLMELKVSLAQEVATLCEVPYDIAEMRIERMERLYAYDGEMKQRIGERCFLLDSSEWAVYKAFRPYLEQMLNAEAEGKARHVTFKRRKAVSVN